LLPLNAAASTEIKLRDYGWGRLATAIMQMNYGRGGRPKRKAETTMAESKPRSLQGIRFPMPAQNLIYRAAD
jgi:hypothetical protein